MAGVIYDQVGSLELSEIDRGERVEMKVDIYESADALRVQKTEDPSTVHALPADRRRGSRCSRLSAVCLGLLCVLLLISNIVLYMYYINEREKNSTISSLSENFTAEKESFSLGIKDLAEERNQLNFSIHNLTKDSDQLQRRFWKLIEKLSCKEWEKNGSSFYFFSTEKKTWNESRKFCRERGADLVIINSKEEQTFLNNKKKTTGAEYWIGLTNWKKVEKNWTWVDDQPLKDGFWRSDEPNDKDGMEDCASFSTTHKADLKTWNDLPCSESKNWICEFNLTKVYTSDPQVQSMDESNNLPNTVTK